ncbi:4-coumarate--CoA ligase-like 5 [Phoenix dactylifera]|uniref:4-coumarate--CoA ligase n=1 Tax=Phoenix dactylifera TaxID=42345 RepID=A0A8B7BXS7_PHODC|nr:4-coumarate--CoA ligase-like 5 [Phoenix dactylifera]
MMATLEEEAKQHYNPAGVKPNPESQSGYYCPRTGVYRSPHRVCHQIPALDAASFVLSQFPPPHLAEIKTALVDSATGRRLTFSDLRRSALALAATLRHGLGIQKGDVVLLLSPNSILYPAIVLGVLSAGAVVTTANPLNTAAEVAKQARDSGAKLAIAAPEEAHKTAAAGVPTILTTRSAPDESGVGGPVSVEELMEGGDPEAMPSLEGVAQSDVAALLYSSGTTGASKGVVLTHANLIAMVALVKWTAEASGAVEDVYLGFIPMFHVYGLGFFSLGLPAAGATTVVMPRFDFHAMLEAVEKHGVSNIPAVPSVVLAMAKAGNGGGRDLSALRRVGTGAAPLGAEVGREFRRRYPWVELREGYGLTESAGAATFSVAAEEAKRRPGAVGQLLPGFEGRVVEVGTGRGVEPGEVGELWLRGPTVMPGYLGNDEATADALVGDGWLRTGDLVYFDQDGYLYVVDRIKELIKVKGFQVAPAELEALLLTHPQILDAAVIPLQDEEAGQVPISYVVRSPNSKLTSEEVIQFVATQVAPYKKVKRVAFIDAIPRSTAGKILRKQLVAQNHRAISSKM